MTVDAFLQLLQHPDGLELGRLEPLTTLFVRTRNSTYRLIVAEGHDVFLQGGFLFPELTPAYVEGAGAGGSLLMSGRIVVGLLMLFRVGGKLFTTSAVIDVVAEPSDDAPSN
jgi:hypothetical protein